eukprot:CAMPEP_0197320704 /NCGR_PEP_ID=MMETSP0891-20130614/61211_1 /TAXON_ID=44058 ORGANISM="Aureoumbra lagunensis, Strain CCMP1510" /NCGR_SAMPLE_ID=MMETSP0891 /ASSEMBLY_ACC=CAM_ASM_000534 /LENGTH=350 /DNA_ID=CAMNT_0042812219 /DNA_START=117 /DNA_END=1169 /DNA_ORIENTATION=-
MSFNIRTASRWAESDGGDLRFGRSWRDRKSRVAKSIEISKAEIVGTQEGLAWQLDELVTILGSNWKRVGVGRYGDLSDEDEHTAILYDSTNIELIDSTDFWLSNQPQKQASIAWGASLPRIATVAHFRHRNVPEEKIIVINTHLDHASQSARTHSAKLLRKTAIALQAAVVMGDFNAPKDEEWFTEMTKDSTLLDAWPLATIKKTGSAGQSTFHNWYGGRGATAQWLMPYTSSELVLSGERHIDAIFVASNFFNKKHVSIARAGLVTDDRRRSVYGGPFASDHYPVVIDIQFLLSNTATTTASIDENHTPTTERSRQRSYYDTESKSALATVAAATFSSIASSQSLVQDL